MGLFVEEITDTGRNKLPHNQRSRACALVEFSLGTIVSSKVLFNIGAPSSSPSPPCYTSSPRSQPHATTRYQRPLAPSTAYSCDRENEAVRLRHSSSGDTLTCMRPRGSIARSERSSSLRFQHSSVPSLPLSHAGFVSISLIRRLALRNGVSPL